MEVSRDLSLCHAFEGKISPTMVACSSSGGPRRTAARTSTSGLPLLGETWFAPPCSRVDSSSCDRLKHHRWLQSRIPRRLRRRLPTLFRVLAQAFEVAPRQHCCRRGLLQSPRTRGSTRKLRRPQGKPFRNFSLPKPMSPAIPGIAVAVPTESGWCRREFRRLLPRGAFEHVRHTPAHQELLRASL